MDNSTTQATQSTFPPLDFGTKPTVNDGHFKSGTARTSQGDVDLSVALDAVSMLACASPELIELNRLQNERDPDLRLIQSWTGRPSRMQSWELEDGAARLVLSVIHGFVQSGSLKLHGIFGENQKAPTFDTIAIGDGAIDIPTNAVYYIEDRSTEEKFVLKAEEYGNDVRLSFDARNPAARIDALERFATEHNYLRGQIFDLKGKILSYDSVSPEEVILTKNQETLINRHVIGFTAKYGDLRARKAKLTRGVLLEGEPGCGKSMLLRSITQRLNGFSVCLASPAQICRGGSVDVLSTIVRMTAPCAVIIEEIDLFGSDRRRMVNPGLAELMQMMDGLQTVPGVLWIGTTNRPEEVERALADRPGRFDRRIKFGPLDREHREKLIDRLIAPQSLTDEAKDSFVSVTEGWTGAQIRELCETLRLVCDSEKFDSDQLSVALDDCGFDVGGTFGFAPRLGSGRN